MSENPSNFWDINHTEKLNQMRVWPDWKWKLEITWDYIKDYSSTLTPREQCLIEEKKNINKECQTELKMLQATKVLLDLQYRLKETVVGDDIDLIYDEKTWKFQFKLYNSEELIIPVNVDFSPIHSHDLAEDIDEDFDPNVDWKWNINISTLKVLWDIIVDLMNNIDNLYIEADTDNISFSELNWYQSITESVDNWFDKSHLNTELLKDIFYYNPNIGYLDEQANSNLNSIIYTIFKAREMRNIKRNANIKIEKIEK